MRASLLTALFLPCVALAFVPPMPSSKGLHAASAKVSQSGLID
jgi:hypothetical protein